MKIKLVKKNAVTVQQQPAPKKVNWDATRFRPLTPDAARIAFAGLFKEVAA